MWREIVELSRPKNVALAAVTVPLGAHLALGGAWNSQALGLVALQTTSAICFMAAGNTLNDIADISIDAKAKPHKPIPSGRISVESSTRVAYTFFLLSVLFMGLGAYFAEDPYPLIAIWSAAAFLMYTYDAGLQTKNSGLVGNIAISLMVGAVIISTIMPFVWVKPTINQWSMMAAIGVFACVGHLFLILSLKYADASKLAPFSYFEIITNIIIGYYFFSDFPDNWTFIGLFIIVLSGIYISRRENLVKKVK